MLRFSLSVTTALALGGGFVVSGAAAQYNLRYDPSVGPEVDSFVGELMARCDGDPRVCADAEQICGPAGPAGGSGGEDPSCHDGAFSFVSCHSGGATMESDCDLYVLDGATGGIEQLDLEVSCLKIDGSDYSVCNYKIPESPAGADETRSFCEAGDSGAQSWVRSCMTTGAGESAPNWFEGDCDGDGKSNGEEYNAGCDPCDDRSHPRLGTDSCEEPEPSDAGPGPGPDASTDAGGGPDASGDAAADTGTGGDSSAGGGDFRGSGGCTCRAAGQRSADADLPVAWALLALLGLGLRFRGSARRAS